MTDLFDEIAASFENPEVDREAGPVQVQQFDEDSAPPGFLAMRTYTNNAMLSVARRGYRHFAGSTLEADPVGLVKNTSDVMLVPMTALMMQTYAAGVMIGHRDDYMVQMAHHFNSVDHLFHQKDFLDKATIMATGFSTDKQIAQHFTEFLTAGLAAIGTLTGFAAGPAEDPGRIWDIWLISGNSCVSACYMAGVRLGTTWHERDVLDGIMIATEEVIDGPQG